MRWAFGRGWDEKNPPNIPRVCVFVATLACRRAVGFAVLAAVVRGFSAGFAALAGFSVGSATVVAGLAASGGIALVGVGSAETVPEGGGNEDGAGLALPTKSGMVAVAAVTGAAGSAGSLGTVSAFRGISGSAEVTSDGSGVDEKLAAGLGADVTVSTAAAPARSEPA